MAYHPYTPFHNNSGVTFFGANPSEPTYVSSSDFVYNSGTSSLSVPNLIIASNGYIGSVGDPDAISIDADGNTVFSQNVNVNGNFTVNGTTTTVNSTTVTVEDPIITLGSGAPTTDDNKDRGIAFNWYDGVAKTGFIGFDDSAGKFTFIPEAKIENEVVTSGTAGILVADLEGNADTATDADQLDGQHGSYYRNWGSLTGLPSPTIEVALTGDVSGVAQVTEALGDNISLSINTTILNNSIELGTDTTGDYVESIDVSGTGLSIDETSGEGSTPIITSNATPVSTTGTLVARDTDTGGFSAGDVVLTKLNVDNIQIDGNTISATDTNGNIIITPNASGALQADSGGDARGANAVDWQMVRSSGTQVASGACSVIAGGKSNTASDIYSVVSGGDCNNAYGCRSVVVGGRCNCAATYSTVSGGYRNYSTGGRSIIGGGQLNCTTASYTVIGGGYANNAAGQNSTIGGGRNNYTSCWSSTVAGGENGRAMGCRSFVGGGSFNHIYSDDSVITGGYANRVDCNSTRSFIGGGFGNCACACYSSVVGGSSNIASGDYSAIAGGSSNTLSGLYSFAVGKTNDDAGYEFVNLLGSGLTATQGHTTYVENLIATGVVTADQFVGDLTGNADTATDADQLDGQHGSYYLDWGNFTNKPDPTVTVELNGDVNGTGTYVWTELSGNPTITISTEIGDNTIVLGDDTEGDYVASIDVAGTGLSIDETSGEGSTPVITSNATPVSTTGTLVARDTSTGGFSAGDVVFTKLNVDNIQIDGNTISATDTNGNIIINPNGNGALQADSGGDARGNNAVDWQMVRATGTQVASGACSVIAGGSDNTASEGYSTVGGGFRNCASQWYSTVGGGYGNITSGASSIVGGGANNCATNIYSSINGGEKNTASGCGSFVGGGRCNTASACLSTVGGGCCNTASGSYSTLSGGKNNCATACCSTVSGGVGNTASSYSATVGGGSNNQAICRCSTVSGGYKNCAWGDYSSINGGWGNKACGDCTFIGAGYFNCACSDYSTVVGGRCNTAWTEYTFVGAGISNRANSTYSAVVAGSGNIAGGSYGFIGNGFSNCASGCSAVVGGYNNNAIARSFIGAGYCNYANSNSVVAGGYNNRAETTFSTIVGGQNNLASCGNTFIGGGAKNCALANYSTLSGGYCNVVSGVYSSILGGQSNSLTGDYNFAVGRANTDAGYDYVNLLGYDLTATQGHTTYVENLIATGVVTANEFVGDLTGNADTATTAVDASGLTSAVTIQVSDQVSGSGTFQDAGDSANIAVSLTDASITGQTPFSGTVDGANDYLLMYDGSDGLRKISAQEFVGDLDIVTSFEVTDGTTTVQINQDEALTFSDGTGAEFVVTDVGGQPTVTVNSVDSEIVHDNLSGFVANEHINHSSVTFTAGSGISGGGDLTTNRRFDIDISEYSTTAVGAGDSFLMLDNDGSTEQRSTVDQLGTYMAGTNITNAAGVLSVPDSTIDGVVFETANFVDSNTVDFTVTAGISVTAIVKDLSITEAKRSRTIDTISVNATGVNDVTLIDATSNNVTFYLPENATAGRVMVVKRKDGSSNNAVISRAGNDSIDTDFTTVQLYHKNETMTFVSDGSDWWSI